MPHSVESDLVLHCLPMCHKMAAGLNGLNIHVQLASGA